MIVCLNAKLCFIEKIAKSAKNSKITFPTRKATLKNISVCHAKDGVKVSNEITILCGLGREPPIELTNKDCGTSILPNPFR